MQLYVKKYSDYGYFVSTVPPSEEMQDGKIDCHYLWGKDLTLRAVCAEGIEGCGYFPSLDSANDAIERYWEMQRGGGGEEKNSI